MTLRVSNRLVSSGPLKHAATLVEANWLMVKGNNLHCVRAHTDTVRAAACRRPL
jgi:hypothetical protein